MTSVMKAEKIKFHEIKKFAKNVDLGIIRRRLSKVEDFTTEFYEQFQSFKCVKDILFNLSEQIEECDRDISFLISKNNQNIGDTDPLIQYNINDLNHYFSNYNSDSDNDLDYNVSNQKQTQEQEVVIDYHDLENL